MDAARPLFANESRNDRLAAAKVVREGAKPLYFSLRIRELHFEAALPYAAGHLRVELVPPPRWLLNLSRGNKQIHCMQTTSTRQRDIRTQIETCTYVMVRTYMSRLALT